MKRRNRILRVLCVLLLVGLCASAQDQLQALGDWQIIQETDPITDYVNIAIYAEAWDNPDHRAGFLVIRCRDRILDIFFDLGSDKLEHDSLQVTPIYRLDKEEPVTVRGGGTTPDGEVFFFSNDGEEELLSGLQRASNFVFRIRDRYDNRLTYQVSLEGFAEAYEYADLGACEE